MPISMSAFLLPSNTAVPFLVEDIYVKGGFQVKSTFAELAKIHPFAKKVGMLAYVIADDKIYKLQPDKTNWEEFKMGMSEEDVKKLIEGMDTGDKIGAELPILLTPVDKKQIISLHNSQKIPPSPGAGYTLMSGPNGTLMWIDTSGQDNAGKRSTVEYEAPTYLQPSQTHDFSIKASRSVLLIDVILNAVDIDFQIFSTGAYDDENPYRFVSGVDVMSDQGITVQDGKKVKHRRYAFFVNRTPASDQLHCRFTNVGAAASQPKVTINYLVLE